MKAPGGGFGFATVAPRRRLSRGVRFALGAPVLVALQLWLGSVQAHEHSFLALWSATYLLAVVVIARRLLRGRLLDPAVCLGGTYLLLLALGSLLYPLLRGSLLSPWAVNAIGVGHAALWVGCELGAREPLAAGPLRTFASRQTLQVLLFLLLCCAGATLALFATFGTVPLLAADPDEARLAILAGRGELAIFLVGIGILAYAFLHDAQARDGSPLASHGLMALTFLVLLSLGGRARALLFVLGYVGLARLARPRRLRPALLVGGVLAGLTVLAGVGAWRRGGTADTEAALAELGIGALALPAMVARIENRVVPGTLEAGPLSDLLTLLPGEDHGANVALKYAVFDNWRAMPASAGVNPSLIGEGYAQFGAAGVVWEPFLLGLVSALLAGGLARRPGFAPRAVYACWITGMMAAVSAGVGIRLTHVVQQLAWIAVIALLEQVRAPAAPPLDERPWLSKRSPGLARVGRLPATEGPRAP